MNHSLSEDINEVIILIDIEKKLGKTTITKEEADFVHELADKKCFPRAEYVLALMCLCGYQIEKDRTKGIMYLARSSRHASYDIQLKIAYIYHALGEFKMIKKTLERALDDCMRF